MDKDPQPKTTIVLEDAQSAHVVQRFMEKWLLGHRLVVLCFFLIGSIFFTYEALQLRPDASFEKMVPKTHPYIANYLKYESELRPLSNVIRIAVENTKGDIYNAEFLDTLRKITDEVFYIPGVDRGNLRSLWTPNVRWYEVTEDGLRSGVVIPINFDGTPEKIGIVKGNILRSGTIGSLVATDHRSATILVPLQEVDPQTGGKLDYAKFSDRLESLIRSKYENDQIKIHITGFAKVIGDLIQGTRAIVLFFFISVLLTTILIYGYCRCWRSTMSTILCCGLAVIWQLGIVRLIGFGLDPYSILVPFLTFAIGVSHAVQNINTMAYESVLGSSRLDSARSTFRMLFIPGTVALICDAVGFSTLLVIDIGVIRELAIAASIGVAVIILTKMCLLPVLMSYVGVSRAGIAHAGRQRQSKFRFLSWALTRFASPRWAMGALALSLLLLAGAVVEGRNLKIGDLDPGAPELRAQSRYNRDVAFFTSHYSASPDVFVVMVQSPVGECSSYAVSSRVDQFQWRMENVPGVESSVSLVNNMKRVIAGNNGGDLRWSSVSRNRFATNATIQLIPSEWYNNDCSMIPVVLFLSDHKADTLTAVINATKQFAAEDNDKDIHFLLAGGNAGIEGATNIVIEQSEPKMLALVYGIVALLVLWEFRSWRVTVAILFPLFITSMLCEAIMARLGLGVKVATLPVIALGVGIGVDYGIYIFNRLEFYLNQGFDLSKAYSETLKTTGQAVSVTGLTLALGVATWIWSDIKFQADMGLLLTFMFLWNMVGALIMTPALIALLMPSLRKARQPA